MARLDPATAFRRPIPPAPVECFDVPHPVVPAHLDGLRILHVSDPHVRTRQDHRRRSTRLLDALSATPADLIVLTGDYMEVPGHEAAALAVLGALREAWSAASPDAPAIGIFGNHDTVPFIRAARLIPGIRWLDNEALDMQIAPAVYAALGPLRILGLSWPEDALAAMLDAPPPPPGPADPPFTLTLAHMPGALMAAADLNLPLVLAGHTHAGQVRLSSRLAPHTSGDVPADLATGMLRLRGTLCCVSRGIGDGALEGLRFNCPPQVPRYTLRRAPMVPLPRGAKAEYAVQVMAW